MPLAGARSSYGGEYVRRRATGHGAAPRTLGAMVEPEIPREVLAAAHERADARARRDWATADRLRAEIEAAGYRGVGEGTRLELTPAHPRDVVDDGLVRYGSSVSVPSRLDEPPTGVATVVMVAMADTVDVVKATGSMADHAPDGTQVVIV